MTRVIIAQLPVSNNIAELPGVGPDGLMWPWQNGRSTHQRIIAKNKNHFLSC